MKYRLLKFIDQIITTHGASGDFHAYKRGMGLSPLQHETTGIVKDVTIGNTEIDLSRSKSN